jgi:ribokinase
MSTAVVVGSCNLDLIVRVPQLPLPGETVLGGDVVARPGGKGANQAVAARRLGADTVFLGAVGNDEFGQTLRGALAREELDLRHLAVVDGPTGVALVVVDPAASNQITVAQGANRHLRDDHLAVLERLLTPGSVLLMQLEIPLRACLTAARAARDAGATVVLNAAPVPGRADHDIDRLLAATDVLVVNESEARSLAAAPAPASADADRWLAVAGELSRSGPPAAIVTLGSSGAVASDQGASFHIPAYRVDPIDTTGAGDAFCGALTSALVEKRPLADAVRRGCAAGALATTALGAQSGMPTRAELDAFQAREGSA